MCCQTRLPLFSSIAVNIDAIMDSYPDLTRDDALEVAEAFTAYLTDADAWDLVTNIAWDVYDRNHPIG